MDLAKRDKSSAEDRCRMEEERANRAEDEIKMLRDQLLEANRAKDSYFSRACQLDDVKIEMDRLRHVEGDNGKLRDTMRDMEHRIGMLNDKVVEMERSNNGLKD
jgi:chromosome segregation ATPase